MSERIIGQARFVDGTTRPVFADGERQYVFDEGERVYGVFIVPEEDRCDAPVIVQEAAERER
jgi:hypothetical protein